MNDENYFALAIPFFIGGMLIELVYQWVTKRALYRFDDLITNLSCGIGQQVIDIFLKVIILGIYSWVYENLRFFKIQPNIYTWILLFILIDLCFYWFHRFAHQVNILWGTHIVHHQSEEFNFSVALRQSWFDNLFNIIFYLPLALIGFDTISFFVLFSFNTIYQFIIHTKLIGQVGFLEYFLNTPSHHRVHHGKNHQYIDKNYGGVFIIWDKLFGTFQKEQETVIYGITTPILSFNPMVLNFAYWIHLIKDLKKISIPSVKVAYLFAKPGTIASDTLELPPYIAKFSVQLKTMTSHISTLKGKLYIGWHFLLTILFFIVLIDFEPFYTFTEKILSALYILSTLTILGILLSVRKTFRFVEGVRIVFSIFILWILIRDIIAYSLHIIILYTLINSLVFIILSDEKK